MRRRPRRQPSFGTPERVGTFSDEALLAGIALGEGGVMEEFISRYERKVYGAALAVVGDRSLAQEVTQDAFIRVWRHADTFDPRRGAVHPWLMRITHNLCVDALRIRRPVAVDPLALLGLADDHPDPMRGTDAFTQVRSALLSLPPEQARSVLLAAMYGYSAQMISEIDDIPLGTAKTRIRLGLEKLRLRLEETAERDDLR